ncbi:hypothetical protein TNIN_98011 [Trichonephila inaurata madagascariensis]|uniref:Endonuclease/exonuclease/phosphatase domain-containing protein n=1 Tax=Trichonephila inaurata madagascariensis TaxID=2747483 RepID=A0A8X7C3V9_9ARAC|nr:hypothetical protein TNIN_98011 [Trichonephila inaurata madagascariensis]
MTRLIKDHLNFVQINLHKSKKATQQLILNLENDNVDVALIQEPYCFRGKFPGFSNTYKIFYDTTSEVIKAAVIVRNMATTVFPVQGIVITILQRLTSPLKVTILLFSHIISNLLLILIWIYEKLSSYFQIEFQRDLYGVWMQIVSLRFGLVL